MASKRKNSKETLKIFGKLIFMASLLFVMLFALYIFFPHSELEDSDEILIVTSSEAETSVNDDDISEDIPEVPMPQVSGHTPELKPVVPPVTKEEPVIAKTFRMDYEVTLAGLYVAKARITISRDKNSYEISSFARGGGIVKSILGSRMTYKTKGLIKSKNKLVPTRFEDVTEKSSGKKRSKVYEFDKNGNFLKYVLRGKEKALDKEIFKNAHDWQSAIFAVSERLAKGEGCAGKYPIFVSENGLTAEIKDKGAGSVKVLGKGKVASRKCGLILHNRAGAKAKGFLLDHEGNAKRSKNEQVKAERVVVTFANLSDGFWGPVAISVKSTGLGDAKASITKFTE